MAPSPEFTFYVLDQLAPLGPVSARRMFGGAGIFLDGRMFALMDDDRLYLKADDVTRPDFESAGMTRFAYEAKSKPMHLSYYGIDDGVLDDADALCAWGRKAIDAALRGAAKKRPKTGSRR